MSYFFEGMHREFFDDLFGLGDESCRQKVAYLRAAGFSEASIAKICMSSIGAGQMFGGCHLGDVGRLVERILFHQGAQGVLLMVTRLPHDECGHVEVSILEVVPPAERSSAEEDSGPAHGSP